MEAGNLFLYKKSHVHYCNIKFSLRNGMLTIYLAPVILKRVALPMTTDITSSLFCAMDQTDNRS